jgi:hypothetical protein
MKKYREEVIDYEGTDDKIKSIKVTIENLALNIFFSLVKMQH